MSGDLVITRVVTIFMENRTSLKSYYVRNFQWMSRSRRSGDNDHEDESRRSSFDITSLRMRQEKDHVCPDLVRHVPTVSVLLGTLFQEDVINFTVDILVLQNTTIIKDNMRINKLDVNKLDSGGLETSDFIDRFYYESIKRELNLL
jgi:hypothetical protein